MARPTSEAAIRRQAQGICRKAGLGVRAELQACFPDGLLAQAEGRRPRAAGQDRALDAGGAGAYLAGMANRKLIAENRRARHEYAIEEDLEAGMVLMGSEVKSLRVGQSNIAESYASVEKGELWLTNAYIAPYEPAKTWGHEARRRRKLLVRHKELARLWSATQREGMTIVPLDMYFDDKGRVKLHIGVAKGRKLHDKRAAEAERDWNRQKGRLLKEGTRG